MAIDRRQDMHRNTAIDQINAAMRAHEFTRADEVALEYYRARFADGWRPSYGDLGRIGVRDGVYECHVADKYVAVFAAHEIGGGFGRVRGIGTVA